MACQRNSSCVCEECAMFSALRLPETKSAVDYGDDESSSGGEPAAESGVALGANEASSTAPGEPGATPADTRPPASPPNVRQQDDEKDDGSDDVADTAPPGSPEIEPPQDDREDVGTTEDTADAANVPAMAPAEPEPRRAATPATCLRNSSCTCTDCIPPPSTAEQPVGRTSAADNIQRPTEQPSEGLVEAEVFEGTLAERLVHKSWKARQAAAVELKSLFDEAVDGAAPCFCEYASFLPKLLNDSNVSVLDKSVAAAISYVEKAANAAQITESIAKPLAEKCLGASRVAIRSASETLALLLIEVDQPNSTAVLVALAAGSASRLAKIARPSLVCMQKALAAFGASALSASVIAQALPPIFSNAKDRKVREEAVKTAVELYRWMGDALMPLLDEVRDSQKKELEAEFEKLSDADTPTPTRILRCLAGVAPEEQAQIRQQAASVNGTVDLFSKEDTLVNLLKELDVKEFLGGMREEKWNLRKIQIDTLVGIAEKSDKLAEGDYGEIISVLKKSLKDSNMAVVASAIRALGLIGRGLRKDFSMHMPALLPVFMDNYRNKNRGVLNAVDFALDSMHMRCYIITEVLETVCEFAASKVPAARTKMFAYVERAVMRTPPKSLRKASKQLCLMLIKGIDDKTPAARDAALQTTGALLHVLDEEHLCEIMESPKMDKFKAKRIRSYAAELAGEAPPAETEAPSALRMRKTLNQAPPPKVGPKTAKVNKTAPKISKTPKAEVDMVVVPAMTDDDVAEAVVNLIPSEVVTMLEEKNFKFKIEGILNLQRLLFGEKIPAPDEGTAESLAELTNALLEKTPQLAEPPAEKSLAPAFQGVENISEIIVRFLGKAIANFKDSNFMVVNKLWALVTRLAESSSGMSKYAASLAVPAMLEKISDRKIKSAARSCLTAIAEICTPNFVYNIAYATLKKAKSPPVLAETVDWIAVSVTQFGVSTVDVASMASACVGCLESSNAAVRKNTIGLVALMHSYIGSGLLDMFADVKASTRDLIEKEIARRGDTTPVEPIRKIRCAIGGVNEETAGGELPRADISAQITAQLLNDMKDSSWKTRGAALDAVEQAIQGAGKRITADVEELPRNLAMLFNDPNQSLKIKSMNLMGMMAAAMGGSPGITRHLQLLLPKMVANVSDNKSVVREATLRNLDTVVAQVGIQAVLPFAPEAFHKPQGMCDMMRWMLKQMTAESEVLDMAPMVEPVVKCLLDRNAAVRSLAEQMLSLTVTSVGIVAVRESPSVKKAGLTAAKDLAKIIAKYDPNSTNSLPVPSAAASAPARKPVMRAKQTARRKDTVTAVTADEMETSASVSPENLSDGKRPLLRLSNKDLRQKRETKKKGTWIMDDMKLRLTDYREDLKRAMIEICDDGLLAELFHRDFKVQIAACTQLREQLGELQEELVSSIDLLFKFVVLKIWETNSQSHAETIELMHTVLDQLAARDYWMTDYEASVIMPHWVEKVGSNNPSIRTGMRNCLHKFLQIYPMSKLYTYLLDGLDSKNTRTRVDCIEELGSLLGDNGLTVFDPKRTVPRVAKWVGNQDRNTSAAALDAMQNIFELCEEPAKFFSLIGSLSDKQRAILDGRFKHNKAAASKIAAARRTRSGGPSRQTSRPLHDHPAPKEVSVPAKDTSSVDAPVDAPSDAAAATAAYPQPDDVESELEQEIAVDSARLKQLKSMHFWAKLESSELEERVIGHKLFLAQLKKDGPDAIVPVSNVIVVAVTKMMTAAFCVECDSVEMFFRNCKYPTNTLMEMLNTPDIALSLQLPCVSFIMTELLALLSMPEAEVPRVMVSDDTNRRYLKNAAMGLLMRCLDHTDQTVAITSVIGIAKRGCNPANHEWTKMLCKCVLKATKTLRGTSSPPNYSAVLLSCHQALCAMPARMRERDRDAAMRFRALKLLVNELSSMDAIDLSEVPQTADQGDGGIRGLLRQLGNSTAPAADTAPAAAAPAASPAPEKLSASGWRLPVQEARIPTDAATEELRVDSSEPVAQEVECTELQKLVERLLNEKCEDDSTIDELRNIACKYPDIDVDAALKDGLPEAMLQLVRPRLTRATYKEPLARQVEMDQEAAGISHKLTGSSTLQQRISALKEAAPAEATAAAGKSPLAPRSVNTSHESLSMSSTTSRLQAMKARLQAAQDVETTKQQASGTSADAIAAAVSEGGELASVKALSGKGEMAQSAPAASPVVDSQLSDIRQRLARLQQRAT